MKILSMRTLGCEKPVFTIDRPNGTGNITFLHFLCEMDILINGKYEHIYPNAAVFYAPRTPQWFRGYSPVVHNWMHLSADTLPYLENLDIQCNKIYYLSDGGFVTELFDKIQTETYVLGNENSPIALCYTEIFLLTFAREIKSEIFSAKSKNFDDFIRLRNYLQQNYASKLSVADLAARVGISQSHFFELYLEIFKISPMEDIINIRINNAKRFLSESDIPVSEIAYRCGYANVTHFIRQFKSRTGLTPKQYRISSSIR